MCSKNTISGNFPGSQITVSGHLFGRQPLHGIVYAGREKLKSYPPARTPDAHACMEKGLQNGCLNCVLPLHNIFARAQCHTKLARNAPNPATLMMLHFHAWRILVAKRLGTAPSSWRRGRPIMEFESSSFDTCIISNCAERWYILFLLENTKYSRYRKDIFGNLDMHLGKFV